MPKSRFDFVRYDAKRQQQSADIREAARALEQHLETLKPGKAKIQAFLKLEECFAWAGKALRDEQVSEAEGES